MKKPKIIPEKSNHELQNLLDSMIVEVQDLKNSNVEKQSKLDEIKEANRNLEQSTAELQKQIEYKVKSVP